MNARLVIKHDLVHSLYFYKQWREGLWASTVPDCHNSTNHKREKIVMVGREQRST
jgi:hypothetical protein